MITLIANPASRSGRGKRLWPFWRRALEEARIPHVFQETASAADCMDKAEQAMAAGHGPSAPATAQATSIVTAIGGDGAINAVMNGMLRASGKNGGNTALGVLYSGTSPDFCRFHGLPLDAKRALNTLIAGQARPIDLAALNCDPEKGVQIRRCFASSCNIGLGAATARFANTWRRYFGDRLGTGLGLVRAMLAHRSFSCRLMLDGEPAAFEKANHVIVLKNPFIASGIRVKLQAKPDDGMFYAIVIHGYSRMGLLGLVRSLYSGDWANLPGVFVRQCRAVSLTTTPVQTVECDGDPCGLTPVAARILPKALRLVVPAEGRGGCHA